MCIRDRLFVVDSPVLSDVTPLCAVLIPVDVDVDNDVTLLFVVLRAVLSEFTPLCAVLRLLENPLTVVDSEATVLVFVLTVVDIDVTRLVFVLTVVDIEVTLLLVV